MESLGHTISATMRRVKPVCPAKEPTVDATEGTLDTLGTSTCSSAMCNLKCNSWMAWIGLVDPGKKCPKVDRTKKNAVKMWQKLAHLRYEIEVFPQPRHSFTCCISISSITSTQFSIVLDMPSQAWLSPKLTSRSPSYAVFSIRSQGQKLQFTFETS